MEVYEDDRVEELIEIDDNFKPSYKQTWIVSKDKLTKNDIKIAEDVFDDKDSFLPYPENDNIHWFQVETPNLGDQKRTHLGMESLDKIGLKEEIEKKVLDKCQAFKYKGPKVIPTRYMLLKNGVWSDWIENK